MTAIHSSVRPVAGRLHAVLVQFAAACVCIALTACGGSADAPPPPETGPVLPVPPTITQQPASLTVGAGQPASFTVAATGTAPLAYQWQRNGVDIAGATSTTYTLTTVLGDSGATFRAVVSNVAGSATSNDATLTVTASAPVLTISPQPASTSVVAGATATFTVGGTCSSGTLDIQWQRFAAGAFADIAGATAPTYSFATVVGDSGATFRAVLDCSGQTSTPSSVATLTVTAPGALTLSPYPLVGLRDQAPLVELTEIAADPDGSFTFIDNDVIRHLSADLTTITLLAGGANGSADGQAGAAAFNQPYGLVLDGAGIVYVADTNNHTIRRIAVDGTVTTLAGLAGSAGNADGSGSTARFNFPSGIALGPDGDLYVADRGNQRIRRVTTAGVVTTYAGSTNGYADGAALAAQFNFPFSVAVAANGDVLVADTANNRIRRVLRNGNVAGAVETLAGDGSGLLDADGIGTAADIALPRGMAVRGNTLTLRDTRGLVRQIDLTTKVVSTLTGRKVPDGTFSGVGFADGPPAQAQLRNARFGICLAPAGGFIVADDIALRTVSAAGDVHTFASIEAIGITPTGTGTLGQMPFSLAPNMPNSVVADTAGGLVVADGTAQLVRRVSTSGVVTLAGGLTGSIAAGNGTEVDGVSSASQFRLAGESIAGDGTGVQYVGDFFGVRRIAADNTTTTYAGAKDQHGAVDGPAAVARFGQVWGVAVGAGGIVYASDYDNGAIRRIDTLGNVTTYAGVMGDHARVDGPIASARFNHPGQMAFAPDGSLYIVDGDATDGSDGVLRVIAADGSSVSTLAGVNLLGGGVSAFNTVRLTAAFAIDTDGTLYYETAAGLTMRTSGGVSTLLIPFNSTVILGASPRVAYISGMTVLGPKHLAILSDGQILQATLP